MTISDLQSETAARADTPKSRISVATVSRVLACMGDAIADNPDLEPVLQRIINNAKKRQAKKGGAK